MQASKAYDAPELLRAWRGDRSYVRVSRLLDCDPSCIYLLEKRLRRARKRIREVLERVVGIPQGWWDNVVLASASISQSTPTVNDSKRKSRGSKGKQKSRRISKRSASIDFDTRPTIPVQRPELPR